MFEHFQPKNEKEWVAQANLETARFENISFPFTFQLSGLSLKAISTAESTREKIETEFEIPNQRVYPLKSVFLSEPYLGGLSQDTLQLGLQDIFVDFDEVKKFNFFGGSVDLSSIISVGIAHAHTQWEEVKRLVDNIEGQKLCCTFYNNTIVGNESNTCTNDIAEILSSTTAAGSSFKLVGVRSDILGKWGATPVQELAAAFSLLVHLWDKLLNRNITIDHLITQTEIALSLSGEFYTDLAKFKAARIFIYYVLDAFGVKNPNPYQIKLRAVSGTNNKTLYDPDGNLLRNTVEALAATVGEADIVSLIPHDFRYRDPSIFGQRMAVNTQHLLEHESYLQSAYNPADGSYFIDRVIDQLVDEAWQLFLEVESGGGYYHSDLVSRSLFDKNMKAREQSFLNQELARVGVTRYTNPLEKLAADRVHPKQQSSPLTENWERIRLKVDQLPDEKKPSIALLQGKSDSILKVTRKITFVSGLITSIGLTISTTGSNESEVLKNGVPDLLIICGDDQWYEESLEAVVRNLAWQNVAKIAVGNEPQLLDLQQKKLIDVIVNPHSDLTQFFKVIDELVS